MLDPEAALSAPRAEGLVGGGEKPTRLPRAIWALGLTSLLMDTSSELVHALLPMFLTGVLGASVAMVGLLEGLAEATAHVTKFFSGWLSDRLGHRKRLTLAGYALAALTKPMFPLAGSVGWVFSARFLDRVGKGIRGAPRDALVTDLTPEPLRGAAFGLRQSMDSIGAVLGPLAALALMGLWAFDLRRVLWVGVVPAVLAVVVLGFGVQEPAASSLPRPPKLPLARSALGLFPRRFWAVLITGAVFSLARFSEAFLILRAEQSGLPVVWVPAVMVVMNVVYASVSYPAGALSDLWGTRGLLLAGLAVLAMADLALAFSPNEAGVLAGAALWGLHMGLTQGSMSRLVADSAPPALRGSAFGLFHLTTGAAALASSALAGALWTWRGPASTFVAGAVFSIGTALAVAIGGRFATPSPPDCTGSDPA